ncbi:glycoside hydrolase family 13 protein [Empedobacter falsenii]|uniref:Glycoside hydrolase family 13 protein n=1 Tax=Empedobacter falsenii TaxID=343874 RepID=A0ABY8VDA5_9FLAO|nr:MULTISPECIES: glycoside hydrolase family 13 protein [Empedobacter]MDM1523899.1 glycoside hydrolase family 13 protein [Empedobacter sp. 225-1]WIH98638.1 glycoside hydrolase family 13 protein [Empedobacter falsenii]
MKKLFVLTSLLSNFAFAQIQKVEPMFWWKGMKNPEVQILVYGKDISKYSIELSDQIKIKDIQKTENPNYVFVTVNTNDVNKSSFKINIKNKNKVVDSYTYELKDRQPNSANRSSFTSKDVVYLIMPDRFANGDESNDSKKVLTDKANRSIPDSRHGGDLRGIINNVDYIQNLGATAVWLTPVNEDNEKQHSYHGYAQTDLYKIDGRYGTNEDYRELSRELNKRGMYLIQDYVTNHWGISHWMIQDLPSQDWIHKFPGGKDGFRRSNYRTTTQFDKNASEIDKKEALDGWFDYTMPDMNQSNPLVLNYLTQNAIWWIEYAELGGMRVDTYPYNNKEGMAKWVKAITTEYPNFNIVGEAWMYSPAHISYWQKDSKIAEIDNYNSHLPSVMDFNLFSELPKAIKEEESWDKGMIKLYNSFTNDFLYPNVNNMFVFMENHDTERWNEMMNGNINDYKLGLSLISTVRGIPQVYYGSEIGMRGDKSKGDADIRRDFPGGWKADQKNAFTNEGRTLEQKQFHDFTAKVFNWRKNKEVIHSGKTKHYMPQQNVYVYFRYNEKESVMVVLNANPEKQTFKLDRFTESLDGITSGKEIISDKIFPIKSSEEISIDGKTAMIIELKK